MNKILLKRYVDEGLSINDICKKVGKGNTSIRYWLKKYKLKTNWKGSLERKVPDNELLKIAKNSKSFTDCLLRVNGNAGGGSYYFYKKRLEKLNFDFSIYKNLNRIPLFLVRSNQEAIQRKRGYRIRREKLHLYLKYNNVEYKCSKCGICEWEGKNLLLHIHHKDENSQNNKLDNLCYLCPNCHNIHHYNDGKLANKLI